MARKKRQRISYVLPLANSPAGHRLGVNGLAIDGERDILYSGGRDGVICAWDLNITASEKQSADLDSFSNASLPVNNSPSQPSTLFRSSVQAHTHWVNDIILTQDNAALVSASSDVSVKLWRPHAQDENTVKTIGVHSDYVKCLGSPPTGEDWVASGGLDHKICFWDLNGAGKKLEIDVRKLHGVTKGSIYALCTNGSILASGGPESVVRLWDPKSGQSITKLVGHTDNVRGILISDDGGTLMTASSDQTVKVWSISAGRCIHTLTMHNDSVWSLYSDHPQLSVFYSSDRSGVVAKTDTRYAAELDEGLSIALCQEHDGVTKVVAASGHIWTATSSSSINRWNDVDTELKIQTPPSPQHSRTTSTVSRSTDTPADSQNGTQLRQGDKAHDALIPYTALLPLSVTASYPRLSVREQKQSTAHTSSALRKASEAIRDSDTRIIVPIRDAPEETIHGQNGLLKHVMLNDRKRVLTVDTAGECAPVKSFGKQTLEDVLPKVNTNDSIANWCTVDTRTGKLSVALEENNCFDAEVYADEIENPDRVEFREDQRINLGKWVLRNLFDGLIMEEIKRDEAFRRSPRSNGLSNGLQRKNQPQSIALPIPQLQNSNLSPASTSTLTPRQTNGAIPMTPGFSIGMASPSLPPSGTQSGGHLTPTAEEASSVDKRLSQQDQTDTSNDKASDYFSSTNSHQSEASSVSNKAAITPSEGPPGTTPASATDDREEKKKSSLFGKKFQMTFPKNMKLGRNSTDAKAAAGPEEKQEEVSDKSSELEEKVFEDNLFGVIQRIRHEYEEQSRKDADHPVTVGITSSLPNESPVSNPPPDTMIIIQEDNPESGGVADLYRGAIGTLAKDADVVEKLAPTWLGELLLKNQIPYKESVKVSFILQPFQDLLPSIAGPDGNARLNANRMLRAKKVLAYVAERIEAAPEHPDPQAPKPEEYLDLYCHDQIVNPNITLATLRVHLWRTGGDIMLYYKANGTKPIKYAHPAKAVAVITQGETAARAPAAAA